MAWRTNLACLVKAGGRWKWFPVPEYSFLPPGLNNICSRRKSSAPEKMDASVAVCDTNGKEPGNVLDKLFSPEQQAAILNVLNTASTKELEAFSLLRGRKSVNIVEHRKKFGPFESLERLIDVPLIQYKTAVQVCNSILCPESGRKKNSPGTWLLKKYIKPDVEKERLKWKSEDNWGRIKWLLPPCGLQTKVASQSDGTEQSCRPHPGVLRQVSLLSVAEIKHHDPKQLGEVKVHFILQVTVQQGVPRNDTHTYTQNNELGSGSTQINVQEKPYLELHPTPWPGFRILASRVTFFFLPLKTGPPHQAYK
ncbi:transcription elongation factor, mitochondrial isoform X2 [Psammomys obesus]|uniref:transcription elongation factor, mitochondrial isoform X2 n=1 Tax=Psammomys obesus TaxID=48139 RepID=UPI002452FF38|nr:transcription elongation factor, mitochondrial isoform X2 [Psammomys obesus]